MERRDFLALLGLGAAGAGLAACSSPASAAPRLSGRHLVDLSYRRGLEGLEQTCRGHDVALDDLREPARPHRAHRPFQRATADVRVNLVNQNSYAGTLAAYAKAAPPAPSPTSSRWTAPICRS